MLSGNKIRMAIKNFTQEQFGRKLNEVVSPSHPVLVVQHLKGRDIQLERIEKALYATGRNIFIYGERGVGKSSLAATAANQWVKGTSKYIDVSCSPDSTIYSIISSIASQAIQKKWLSKKTTSIEGEITLKWFRFKASQDYEPIDFNEEINSLNDVVEILKEISILSKEPPVVVMDEVDRINDENEIERLADLLKQLGDKRVNVKFIFTGVGTTLDEILGSHRSAIRQLETIELKKLDWDARWEIAIEALNEFDISIDKDINIRIALISDGYPYYIHKIVEQLLWVLFEKDTWVTEVCLEDYYKAISRTVDSISAELSRPYEKAVNQRSQDYEEVVWSTTIADDNIGIYLKPMYDSYKYIMNQRHEKICLDQTKYANRIRNLLKEENGSILAKGLKTGQYIYNEKMLRGYVRLRAEVQKIKLIEEDSPELKDLKYKTQATVRSTRSYGSRIPILPRR